MTLDRIRLTAAETQRIDPAELIRSEDRLRDVIEGAQVGTWTWDFDSVGQIVNDVWARMLGYELAELQPLVCL